MASPHDEMFYDSTNRSPGTRGYQTMNLNRQASTQFEQYRQPASMYGQDDYSSMRYDTQRGERTAHNNLFPQNYPGYDSQTWNYNAPTASATMGPPPRTGGRNTGRRAGLPSVWMDQQQHQPQYTGLPTPPAMNTMPNGMSTGMPNGHAQASHYPQQPQPRQERSSTEGDNEELIPTAIVIKNIPFAIKREQLTDVMSEMHLPLPYAFNYHFDNGVFRGLAFANFSSPEETALVIETMNQMELQGRKLRVEYKKMLPLQERERIEREKRERRGQLEEQHRPIQQMGLHTAQSISSISSQHPATSPSPVSMRSGQPETKIDMNDAKTLDYYAKLVVFKDDEARRVYVIEPPVSATYRRIIHELAHKLGLEHESAGTGENRHVQICKDKQRTNTLSSLQTSSLLYNDTNRRGLARAATMDFNDSRDGLYHGLRTQNSSLLDVPGSPGLGGINGQRSLREAKSFGDLQHRTSSPALSSSSFPANLAPNVRNYEAYGLLNGSQGLTSSSNLPINGRDDSYLTNSFSNMNLGGDYRNASTSRLTGRLNGDSHTTTAGAIGSQRGLNGVSLSNNYDDSRGSTSAAPERQPRGPGAEWGTGFRRQNGHGGRGGSGDLDDLDQNTERNGQNNSRYM